MRIEVILSLILLTSLFFNAFFFYRALKRNRSVFIKYYRKLKNSNKKIIAVIKRNEHFLGYWAYLDVLDEIKPMQTSNMNVELKSKLPVALLIKPGLYEYENELYPLRNEGLYRFIQLGTKNLQFVVFQNDILALVSSICWISTHGNSDNNLNYQQLIDKAQNDKLYLTCTPLSFWAYKLCKSLNIKARVVQTLTLDQWNAHDNGHTMLEIFHEDLSRWVLYDLSSKAYFLKDNYPLSLIDFVNAVNQGLDYDIITISSASKFDISNFKDQNRFNYAFWLEYRSNGDKNLRLWYRRVSQAPMVFADNKYYFFNEASRDLIESYSDRYTYLEAPAFLERFYQYCCIKF